MDKVLQFNFIRTSLLSYFCTVALSSLVQWFVLIVHGQTVAHFPESFLHCVLGAVVLACDGQACK